MVLCFKPGLYCGSVCGSGVVLCVVLEWFCVWIWSGSVCVGGSLLCYVSVIGAFI